MMKCARTSNVELIQALQISFQMLKLLLIIKRFLMSILCQIIFGLQFSTLESLY